MSYEAVIGIEIHVQLNTATKMFCSCPNTPGDDPNTNICPTCLYLPGTLPRLSLEALEKATQACIALNCDIQSESAFDQKIYYYPDLPKGFQLSQHHKPLAINGWLEIEDENGQPKKLLIHHVHMEEDVAKLVHETEGRVPISLVDFNRAGTALIEVVTEPDMRTPYDAMEFLRVFRNQIRYTGCAECSMELGTMRCDANISLRPEGSDVLNTKVEVKNMNSIRHVGDAIAYEVKRQTKCLNTGEPILLHTRLWDPEKHVTTAMRSKFAGPCVPDPSVPPILITDAWLAKMAARLPEMPNQKAKRFGEQYRLNRDEAVLMSSDRHLSDFFEEVVNQEDIPPRTVAGWLATQMLPALKGRSMRIADSPVTPVRFAALVQMVQKNEINANSAKTVLAELFDSTESPEAIVERLGVRQVSDTGMLESIVTQVLAEQASAVEDYKKGNKKSIGFLIGQAMRASGGNANPKLVQQMLLEKLAQ
jgi:aspartyl-tRNA(Asn)/glutamyl-tRNA(Gln) amidotransferase subunit B